MHGYRFKLYISGRTRRTERAIANLRRIGEHHLGRDYELVDAAQLGNALLNLALNARDAMPDGGRLVIETANIHLDADYAALQVEVEPGPYVLLAESDTGTGIAAEDLGHVFEPFFSPKAPGKGTGLGLAMVYGSVKQSGGHVVIYSEPDDGTVVKLYLPRVGAGEAPQPPPQPAALRLRPWIKVLYTSGYAENAIVHHGRLDAGVQLLVKPYRRAELARRIREALQG